MKKLVITAALLLTAAPASAEDKPDWAWTIKTPIPFLNQVELTPQPQQVVQQPIPVQYQPQPAPVQYLPAPAPQQIPVPYPMGGGGGTPGVVVIPITTGTGGGGSNTSMAELMMLKMLMDQDNKSKPRRKGLGDVLGDVLVNTSAGFARGAAENFGRSVSDGWFD